MTIQFKPESPSRAFKTDDQRTRLDLNLPENITDGISIPALLRTYKDIYTSDPVTERDIELLILELRPNVDDVNDFSMAPKGVVSQSRFAVQAADKQALASRSGNNAIEGRDCNVETHPNAVIKEFVSAWKDIRPGGAWSHESAAIRPQRRALNVLSWGFGE